MAIETGIEWTDATWNPVRGCTRVSEGCRNCYAEKVAYRFSGESEPYEGLVQVGADGERRPQWNGTVRFVEEHLLDPLRWKKPRRIFVNSMSDLFHEGVTDEQLDRIFAVMALCPQHTFQVLTKRPERMRAYLSCPEREKAVARACIDGDNDYPLSDGFYSVAEPGNHNLYEVFWKNCRLYFIDEDDIVQEAHREERWMQFVSADFHWPLANVWLGVSVEDQTAADARVFLLLQAPASVRFLSVEPMLGRIDLKRICLLPQRDGSLRAGIHVNVLAGRYSESGLPYIGEWDICLPFPHGRCALSVDWVICGGESGHGARPMHPDWARSIRDQCVEASVPFFFKQWGEFASVSATAGAGAHYTFPDGATMRKVGKKLAGRLLDGCEWNQMPGDLLASARSR